MNRNDAALGEAVVRMLCAGRFGEAYEHFGTSLRALLSLENLTAAWHREIGPEATPGAAEVRDGVVAVPVPDREATVLLSVVRGKLGGLRIVHDVALWQPPHYADAAAFDEEEIDLATAAGPVPGTVSVPRRGATPRPAVVLLGGGGPFDRDGTAGANKTMKDIAWGLATGGVIVLRFDKPSHLEAARGGNWAEIPPTADYVPPAVAAVRALRARADVDPRRIFVLGHSMGGRYAPRVAVAEPTIAGLILLSADTQPMQRAAVRVARYLMTVAPESARAMLPDPEELLAQAERVERADLSESTPAGELPLGLAAGTWLDLREYDPVATAITVRKPMFIAQGGRDYQVTVVDDLAGWDRGLGDRDDVDIRVYESDDHMFFTGSGTSRPSDYAAPQHVDGAVVADIAVWMTAVTEAEPDAEAVGGRS
ncbi:alpha/beta hydrolase family protein [Nocardia mikamii]|uniref:alpha/beta hydrolase family protein n=1 Tax=Nocardia mikamii TaxID=508464 RepID=UPI0007A41619|nr:alpha/beta fold hydrolase [Nocardia mikamii]